MIYDQMLKPIEKGKLLAITQNGLFSAVVLDVKENVIAKTPNAPVEIEIVAVCRFKASVLPGIPVCFGNMLVCETTQEEISKTLKMVESAKN